MNDLNNPAGHAFISYAHEDTQDVDQLQRVLEAAGVRVWRDTADLWPGENWRVKIRQAITGRSFVFVACFSRTGVARKASYQYEELAVAIEQMRRRQSDEPWLIPVRLDECQIPDLEIGDGRTLTSIQQVDLFGNHFGEGVARLVSSVLRVLGSATSATSSAAMRGAVDGPALTSPPGRAESQPGSSVLGDGIPTAARAAPTLRPAAWGNVPQRNQNFTGREEVLRTMRERLLATTTALPPLVLCGSAGVGKTQLATEYAYRRAAEYDMVWWILADQSALTRSAFANLASRLGIADLAQGRTEDALTAVLEALKTGMPYRRWLLIIDNAGDTDEIIRDLLPPGPGNAIITTRNRGWAQIADTLEVDVFAREESMQFLTKRIATITRSYADRLANTFGDLPLGLEEATTCLLATGMTVDLYLDSVSREGNRLPADGQAARNYPPAVAAAGSLSVTRLSAQKPEAMELLKCCAFFGPAAIPLDVLERGKYLLTPPLQATLNEPALFGAAIRALGQFSLAKIDNIRQTLKLRRLIQLVTRDALDQDSQHRLQHDVHLLLSAADPNDPDTVENWPRYADLLGHVGPAELVQCQAAAARRLTRNVVRYHLVAGDYGHALTSAENAIIRWLADSGPNDSGVLVMNRLKIQVLQALAWYEQASELDERTLKAMRSVLGENHEETLILLNCHCIDLWATGEFAKSLELTSSSLRQHEQVFGVDHPRTFAAKNNYAEALELNSRYAAAREVQEQLYEEKLMAYGRDDHARVLFTLGALGRSLLWEGLYSRAHEIAERAFNGFRRLALDGILPDNNPWFLAQSLDLSMALRAVGAVTEALGLAEETHGRYRRGYYKADHPKMLAAAASLGNSQLLARDFRSAAGTFEATTRRYSGIFGADHPYALACSVNLAIAQRQVGDVALSRSVLEHAAEALQRRLGRRHYYYLACITNLASAMAELGDAQLGAQLNEEAFQIFVELLGPLHPVTLTCAANLAANLKASGQSERGADLAVRSAQELGEVLMQQHPIVREAQAGRRVDIRIELAATF